jgi:hypothetical protein
MGEQNQNITTHISATKSPAKVYNKAGGTACSTLCATTVNPHCEDCITGSHFMNGALTKSYSVTWNSCNTLDPHVPGCNGVQPSPYVSTVTFCYSDDPNDCALYMEVSGLPACIPCITAFPYCVRMKATCAQNGNDWNVELDDTDPNTEQIVTYSYTVSQDPKITVCCTMTFQGATYKYCCTGDM